MSLHIRKATSEDLAFLIQLEKAAFQEFQQNTKENLKKGIHSEFQEVLVVEDTNLVKQLIAATILFKYKHTLRIYSVAVLPEYQNKGIGNVLIEYIKEYALENNFSNIVLEVSERNTQLIDWYQKRAFVVQEKLTDYYCEGENGLKMKLSLEKKEAAKNILVIDQPFKWERTDINAKIISVKDYINNTEYQNNSGFRIFNLCSSYKYQSYGYYVSLLASARGQRVIPSNATLSDLRIMNVIQSIAFELNELVNQILDKTKLSSFSLNIYFGQTPDKKYQQLAAKLYQFFEAPLFKVTFIKDEKWLIKNIKVLTFKGVPIEEKEFMYQFAANYFNKKRHSYPKLTNYTYDVAVLVNPKEKTPPSNQEALQKLKNAANKKGVYLEFITPQDIDKINEFDALFIRETTNVNHHTYEISRLAFAEGLVVMDDPWSILRCSNKIYQNELFKKNKISTPNTVVLTKNMFQEKQLDDFNFPIVIKQPDSAFSLGVIKVSSKEEAKSALTRLFKITDMVICQEFLYSEFDWRIGLLDNKPLFACKYFMAKDHWQIYDWNSSEEDQSGDHATVDIKNVPKNVLQVAQKAASLIGDGLYGVDLKYVDGKVYVVEVNDNPNIDAGVEDLILQDSLYDILIESIINRIEIAKNIRKIKLTSN
ncbi:GNAT family N-acetyltransferase [Tenacibaculum sp. TC6]|uniref:GNAT family N-acetyltransferase n=1 Tax=Tenacibaculum sp. TC6 TaxID=3423223 RepID=UPI003D3700D1